jgi:hypothetical protein
MEIAEKVAGVPAHKQSLSESFAESIEKHMHSREMLAACKPAKEPLAARDTATQTGDKCRTRAIAALENIIATID